MRIIAVLSILLRNLKQFLDGIRISRAEEAKQPKRTDVINYLLSRTGGEKCYLEIGVRNPKDNFAHIRADKKYSVDPGIEFKENPADFKIASDEFFARLGRGEILSPDIKFSVIFIDGLHISEQADRDIRHALQYIREDGFVVLHDCNPPTEWHAREDFRFYLSPAGACWNGTVWKAFLKWRCDSAVYSCCVNSDWGVGILSKSRRIGGSIPPVNRFFEYGDLAQNRETYLNLISFEALQKLLAE